MTIERPYQKTKTFEEAVVELRECAGKQFDLQFIEPFITMIKQVNECEEKRESELMAANR
ncbi:hypothetical protein V7128_02380 [Neobacillus vireti]